MKRRKQKSMLDCLDKAAEAEGLAIRLLKRYQLQRPKIYKKPRLALMRKNPADYIELAR